MGRIADSWTAFKSSWGVIRQDPELLVLPVISFLAAILTLALIGGLAWTAGVDPQLQDEQGNYNAGAIATMIATYLGLAFVQVFFYGAMIGGVHERLSGGDPTVGSALRAAAARLGPLFLWSVIVATVNIVLRVMRDQGRGGQLAAMLGGAAWNIASFFVVPAIMIDGEGFGDSFKRSGRALKQRWGEGLVGDFLIGLVAGLIGIAIGAVALVLAFVGYSLMGFWGAVALGGIGLLGLLAWIAIATVVQAAYKTELYRFAQTGKRDPGFEAMELQRAFVQRGQRSGL